MTKIRNERQDITTDPTNIKKIIRECYEQFYVYKFNNAAETDQFLKRYNQPKLTQEALQHLNRPVSI